MPAIPFNHADNGSTVAGAGNLSISRRGFLRHSLRTGAAMGAGLYLTANAGLARTGAPSSAALAAKAESAAAVAVAPSAVMKADPYGPDRRLRLVNAHTWEKIDVVYWTQGVHVSDSINLISHLMRDHRANEALPIDANLLDDLYQLHTLLETSERIHVLSGYRTPETNAQLRKRSAGVAKYSLHMEGRAADINIPGRTAKQIQQAALSMRTGGVGYYKSSGFVHLDTGDIRSWERA